MIATPLVANQHVCSVCGDRFVVGVRGNEPQFAAVKAEGVAKMKALAHLVEEHPERVAAVVGAKK